MTPGGQADDSYVDLAAATTLVLDLTNLPSGTDYDGEQTIVEDWGKPEMEGP